MLGIGTIVKKSRKQKSPMSIKCSAGEARWMPPDWKKKGKAQRSPPNRVCGQSAEEDILCSSPTPPSFILKAHSQKYGSMSPLVWPIIFHDSAHGLWRMTEKHTHTQSVGGLWKAGTFQGGGNCRERKKSEILSSVGLDSWFDGKGKIYWDWNKFLESISWPYLKKSSLLSK